MNFVYSKFMFYKLRTSVESSSYYCKRRQKSFANICEKLRKRKLSAQLYIGWGGYLHNLDLNCSVDRFWRQYSQKPKNLDQLGGGEGGNFDKNYFCSKDFLSQTFIQLEMVFKLYEFLFSQMFFI